MAEPVLSGFHYDAGKAKALAHAWAVALQPFDKLELTAADQIAAVGYLAAGIMLTSGFRRIPARATQALADFIAHLVTVGAAESGPPP